MLGHELLDEWSHLRSPLHRTDARVKLPCALVLVVAIVMVPVSSNWLLMPFAALIFALAVASGLPGRWILKRLLVIVPFLAISGLLVALLPQAEASAVHHAGGVGGRQLVRHALAVWLSVGGKCVLTLVAATLLTGTSSSADLVRAAQALRMPHTLTALTGLAMTYLGVLSDEVARMITASRSRGRVSGLRRRAGVLCSVVVTAIVRGFERAERVALAMVSRGYDGRIPDLTREPVPHAQIAGGVCFVICTCALYWAGVGL